MTLLEQLKDIMEIRPDNLVFVFDRITFKQLLREIPAFDQIAHEDFGRAGFESLVLDFPRGQVKAVMVDVPRRRRRP